MNITAKIILVVEGREDLPWVQRLWAARFATIPVRFLEARGAGRLPDVARLAAGVLRRPVLVLGDADTLDPHIAEERRAEILRAICWNTGGVPVEVLLGQPALDPATMLPAATLARCLEREALSAEEQEQARVDPREFWKRYGGGAGRGRVIDALRVDELRALDAHPILQGIRRFLTSIQQDEGAVAAL